MPSNASNALWNNFLGGFVNKGKDVSQIKLFSPVLQAGAAQGKQIGFNSGVGDAALQKAGGGTNAAIVNADTNIAQQQNNENTAQAVAGLAQQGLQEGSAYEANESALEDTFNLGKANVGAQGIASNSQFTSSPWASFLPNLLSGAAKAAVGMI